MQMPLAHKATSEMRVPAMVLDLPEALPWVLVGQLHQPEEEDVCFRNAVQQLRMSWLLTYEIERKKEDLLNLYGLCNMALNSW